MISSTRTNIYTLIHRTTFCNAVVIIHLVCVSASCSSASLSHLAAARRCFRKVMLASFKSTILVPRSQLAPLVPSQQPTRLSSSAKELVFIYFPRRDFHRSATDDEAAAILLSTEKAIDSKHAPFACSCVNCSEFSSSKQRTTVPQTRADLIRSTHQTMIFKADKPIYANEHSRLSQQRQELEHAAVKRFPSVKNGFIITTYCRAYCDGSLLSLITAPIASPSASDRHQQLDSERVMGILMERCVASLADVMWADDLIDSNLTVSTAARSLFGFEWQTTSAPCDSETRPSFGKLCEATCTRLLGDLRDSASLLHHCVHLCYAVRYMHMYGVVHCDLKPENVFVRVLQSTPIAVSSVQLVLGDFDCSHVFDVAVDRSGLPVSVNWTGKQNTIAHGTFGYAPNVYSPLLPFSDALSIASNGTLPLNYSPQRSTTDKQIYQPPSPAFDVFGLGMVFLSMLLRCSFRATAILWIKSEILRCDKDPKTCTAAHVILFHKICTNTLLRQRSPEQTYDLLHMATCAKKRDRHSVLFKRAQERLKQQVELGSVPVVLTELLVRMTAPAPEGRPTVVECITVLERLIRTPST
jgi:hypothetical protein